jgi:preprotein translocase subunit SecD
MNETALIAIGILMEETAREVLGKTGDLAFTEAADEEEERALSDKREQTLSSIAASHQDQASISAKEGDVRVQGDEVEAARFDPWFSDDTTTDNQAGDSSEEDA